MGIINYGAVDGRNVWQDEAYNHGTSNATASALTPYGTAPSRPREHPEHLLNDSQPSASLTLRSQLDRLQEEISRYPQTTALETEHHFCDGMYARVYRQPADILVVSKIHKKENFFIVAAGKAVITTDDGPVELSAGMLFVTKPGTKRAVLTGPECGVTIITVHRVGRERRLDRLEKRLTEHNEADRFTADNKPKPGVLTDKSPEFIT